MEGERGLIEREGVLGPVGMSSLSFIASFSSRIPVVVSPYSACLRVPLLSCPRSLSSLSCGRPVLSSRVFPCGCRGAWCQRAGRTSLGRGGTHRGVVSSFGCHIATATRHLVSVSFSWWWQPFLCVWVSVRVRCGAFVVVWGVVIVVWAVVDCRRRWALTALCCRRLWSWQRGVCRRPSWSCRPVVCWSVRL